MLCRFLSPVIIMLLFIVTKGFAQTNDLESDTSLTADVLISTLYAKTDAEEEYCRNIIQLRDTKIIPNRILYGVYRRAVCREKDRRLTYFQTALEILCKREGIDLSPSVPVKSTNFFGFTSTLTSAKPTVSAPTKPQTTTSKPLTFFYNMFRRID